MGKSLGKISYFVAYDKIQIEDRFGAFIPIAGIMLGSTLLTAILPLKQPDQTGQLVGFGITLLMITCTALCIQLFLATYYVVDRGMLTIHGGWLYKRKKIPVASIRKIEETRTFISAPAPSLDRLEIFYNKFDSVVISPEDKAGFIAELTRLNPEIEVV